ncbi:hypothetical protein [Nguyenibacter vanlangensis]|uniref:Uncharacterized protein n=1 Tax=Nguyenibacter vanlangensis TaxID=1216886 RepID=A0A7Y7M5L8_9PROT|nr:hypothetical protein [Nguyenibacter vanlangensis]NVN09746.1 hypothetical protein [Nguyenibacter vanlangensis]
MTPREAYAALGLREPFSHGKAWAEAVWGVEGRPLHAIMPSMEARAEVMRDCMEHDLNLPETIIDKHIECFVTAAKARLYDLAMAPKVAGNA